MINGEMTYKGLKHKAVTGDTAEILSKILQDPP
jgi:hypothetical protein